MLITNSILHTLLRKYVHAGHARKLKSKIRKHLSQARHVKKSILQNERYFSLNERMYQNVD